MNPSPLYKLHDQEDVLFLPFGDGVQIVGAFDAIELEYAALRKAAGLMDRPERALVELIGSDRLDFLHRMLTADCNAMQPGQGRRAFLLDAKGRIISDMLVLHSDSKTLIELDVITAKAVIAELDKLLFAEDVQIAEVSDRYHLLSLHGPKAGALINQPQLQPMCHTTATVHDSEVLTHRYDTCGVPGFHLWLPQSIVEQTWNDLAGEGGRENLRPIGWQAYNTARLEAGTPLFQIDFGPNTLPHETGVIDEAVSFTKGCYRGQEVVARIESLGHPKQVIIGFRVEGQGLPVEGTPIFGMAGDQSQVIGAVTSSTPSPMLGNENIGLAMVKWGFHELGTKLATQSDAGRCTITVTERPFV